MVVSASTNKYELKLLSEATPTSIAIQNQIEAVCEDLLKKVHLHINSDHCIKIIYLGTKLVSNVINMKNKWLFES